MKQLTDRLNLIDWTSRQWRTVVGDILKGTPSLSDSLAAYISEWDLQWRAGRFNGSHVTTTHYKYLVYRDQDARFTLWLHDYKPEAERGYGYAEVPHNHRYDLCSIILKGGYDSVLYDVADDAVPIETATFRPGDILSLAHDQVHSLTAICDSTQTLFVEGPTISNFSTVYPPAGPPRRYFDFYGLVDDMLIRLKDGI